MFPSEAATGACEQLTAVFGRKADAASASHLPHTGLSVHVLSLVLALSWRSGGIAALWNLLCHLLFMKMHKPP